VTSGFAALEPWDTPAMRAAEPVGELDQRFSSEGATPTEWAEEWHFDVRDGAFSQSPGNVALVFEVAARKVFGFRKGDEFSQMRWRFLPD
jgi:hypothetical protein